MSEFTKDLTVEYDYTPRRLPPGCNGQNDPNFCDPGDPASVPEFNIYLMGENITDTIEKYEPKVYQKLMEKAYRKGDE